MAPDRKIKHNNHPKTHAGDKGCIGEEVRPVGSAGGAQFDCLRVIKLGEGVRNENKSSCLLNKLLL
jgi:hypothetical protein